MAGVNGYISLCTVSVCLTCAQCIKNNTIFYIYINTGILQFTVLSAVLSPLSRYTLKQSIQTHLLEHFYFVERCTTKCTNYDKK